MRAVFRRPNLDDTKAVRGTCFLSRIDTENDWQVAELYLPREGGEVFGVDAQAVTAARVLLLESLEARLLRLAQAFNNGLRERVRAQQFALFARPDLAAGNLVRAPPPCD